MAYSVLFIAAFCITFGVQYRLGLRRGLPALPLALALTATILLFILFMKLPFVWSDLEPVQIASTRYMVTGSLGAMIALVISRYTLRIGLQRLDDASLVFPFTLGLVKVGCFFAGCCFGIPGGGAFGVTYSDPSTAFAYHVISNSGVGHDHTVPLHPVQLYEAAGCLAILGTLWLVRNRWKQPGSSFFFLLVLYVPLRFATEFFRDSDAQVWYGLKNVQIVSLLLVLSTWLLLRRNEKRSLFSNPVPVNNRVVLLAFFCGLVVLFFLFSEYLHVIEKVVVILAMAGIVILMLVEARRHQLTVHRAARIPVATIIILLFTAQGSRDMQEQDTISYKTFHFGISGGDYVNALRDQDGCGATVQDYNQKYFMVGAGFSWFKQKGKYSQEFGVSAFGGDQSESPMFASPVDEKIYTVWGAHSYFKFDTRWVGFGAGLNIGNLRFGENRIVNPLFITTPGYSSTPAMPSVHFRVGPKRFFFAQYDLANAFPAATPGNLHQLSIGSGFGLKNGMTLSFGSPLSHTGTFLNLTLPVKAFTLNANYTWGVEPTTFYPENYRINQYRFSLSYRLKD